MSAPIEPGKGATSAAEDTLELCKLIVPMLLSAIVADILRARHALLSLSAFKPSKKKELDSKRERAMQRVEAYDKHRDRLTKEFEDTPIGKLHAEAYGKLTRGELVTIGPDGKEVLNCTIAEHDHAEAYVKFINTVSEIARRDYNKPGDMKAISDSVNARFTKANERHMERAKIMLSKSMKTKSTECNTGDAILDGIHKVQKLEDLHHDRLEKEKAARKKAREDEDEDTADDDEEEGGDKPEKKKRESRNMSLLFSRDRKGYCAVASWVMAVTYHHWSTKDDMRNTFIGLVTAANIYRDESSVKTFKNSVSGKKGRTWKRVEDLFDILNPKPVEAEGDGGAMEEEGAAAEPVVVKKGKANTRRAVISSDEEDGGAATGGGGCTKPRYVEKKEYEENKNAYMDVIRESIAIYRDETKTASDVHACIMRNKALHEQLEEFAHRVKDTIPEIFKFYYSKTSAIILVQFLSFMHYSESHFLQFSSQFSDAYTELEGRWEYRFIMERFLFALGKIVNIRHQFADDGTEIDTSLIFPLICQICKYATHDWEPANLMSITKGVLSEAFVSGSHIDEISRRIRRLEDLETAAGVATERAKAEAADKAEAERATAAAAAEVIRTPPTPDAPPPTSRGGVWVCDMMSQILPDGDTIPADEAQIQRDALEHEKAMMLVVTLWGPKLESRDEKRARQEAALKADSESKYEYYVPDPKRRRVEEVESPDAHYNRILAEAD
jgi:hypothetical protein